MIEVNHIFAILGLSGHKNFYQRGTVQLPAEVPSMSDLTGLDHYSLQIMVYPVNGSQALH